MNSRKGFTLVEMLVVIAVIGIISTVALTALGPSRNKAKDTRVISNLQQVRALAETVYSNGYAALPAGQPIADNAGGILETNRDDIVANGGSLNVTKSVNNSNYSAYSSLLSGGFYCVDSNGFAGNLGVAPVVDGQCQ